MTTEETQRMEEVSREADAMRQECLAVAQQLDELWQRVVRASWKANHLANLSSRTAGLAVTTTTTPPPKEDA